MSILIETQPADWQAELQHIYNTLDYGGVLFYGAPNPPKDLLIYATRCCNFKLNTILRWDKRVPSKSGYIYVLTKGIPKRSIQTILNELIR